MSDIDDDYIAPKTPFDYISRDQLQDMWGAGFTVIRRNTFGRDTYELADRVKRPGMARQWVDRNEVTKFCADGWVQVESQDYPGLFAPFGYAGPVEVGTLVLVECPQHKVDKFKAAQVAAADKLVTDWQEKFGGQFSGAVTVATQTKLGELDSVTRIALNTPAFETTEIEPTKTIEDTTAIPRDMHGYVFQIFAERDRLSEIAANAMDDNTRPPEVGGILDEFKARVGLEPETPRWPTLNAIILPIAIKNVRKRINEEAASAKAS